MLDPVGDDDAAMPGGEWVELYNNSATDIDAAGWYLYDSNDSHELQITAGNSDNDNDLSDGGETIVPANGWLVVYSNGDGDFALNNTGSDSVRLYDGLLATAHLADRYDYTVSHITGDSDPIATPGAINKTDGDINENSEGKSYARFPDGTGAWFDPIPTPGGENTKSLNLGKFIEYYSDRCVENDKAISIKKDPVCETNFLTELGILDKYGKISKDEQEVIPDKPDVSQTDALIEAPVSEEQNLASTDVNNEEIMAVDTASAVNGQSSDNPAANTNINSSAANPDPYLKKEEEISATLDAAILNNKSEDNSEKKDDSKDKIGGDGGSGDGSASKSIDSVIP